MNTSQTSFLSEITSGQEIPYGKLAYFRERQRNRLYDRIVSEFVRRQQCGLTKADIARRIHKSPEQITRWLAAPGNWTLDTISDLLLAIGACELEFTIAPLDDRAPRNYVGPDWVIRSAETESAPAPKVIGYFGQGDESHTASTSANVYMVQSATRHG